MKVEIKSKKGLRTVLSVIIDKKSIQTKMNEKLGELQKEGAERKRIKVKLWGEEVFVSLYIGWGEDCVWRQGGHLSRASACHTRLVLAASELEENRDDAVLTLSRASLLLLAGEILAASDVRDLRQLEGAHNLC